MIGIDVFGIYRRVGNLFRMKYNYDALFVSECDPSKIVGEEATIFFEGKFLIFVARRF